MRFLAALLALFPLCAVADEAAEARQRWEQSEYGPMLERILPPTFDASALPEPGSDGAKLTQRYCVQCHNLPNPAMHPAGRWPSVVDRMVKRMRGGGNMGKLMADMMAGVKAPSERERRTLLAYLRKHGQRPIDAARYPELARPEGEPFRLACSQCHVLPDPRRHTAEEWPAVVARMQRNMQWMNRVVGSRPDPDEPQLRVEAILAFLQKYARP